MAAIVSERAAQALEPPCARSAAGARRARGRPGAAGRSATRSQLEHRVADRLAHAPHLAVAALADRELDHVAAPRGAPAPARWGRRRAPRRRAAPQRAAPRPARRRRARGRSSAPRSAGGSAGWRARRRWSAGSARSSRRRAARPGYRRRPLGGHQLDHGRAAVRVARGRERRRRGLLQRVGDARLGPGERAPVDRDAAAPRRRRGRDRVTTSPSTLTRPAAISVSAARREATPAWARYLARRIVLQP